MLMYVKAPKYHAHHNWKEIHTVSILVKKK